MPRGQREARGTERFCNLALGGKADEPAADDEGDDGAYGLEAERNENRLGRRDPALQLIGVHVVLSCDE
jgi:hypothetical protein